MEFDPDNFSPGEASQKVRLDGALNSLSEGAKQFVRQYVPADDDQGCIGMFEMVDEYKPFKSREEGREIYEPVLFVRITIRGNDKLEVHRQARDEDKRRFPFSWQEFQRGEQSAARGTPLSKLPGIDPSTLRGYHAKNIYTIEDLSLVSDTNLQNIGLGGRELRQKALAFVQQQSTVKAAEETVARSNQQVAHMQAQIDAMREQNAKQSAQLERAMALLATPQRKKPGPKPKIKKAQETPAPQE